MHVDVSVMAWLGFRCWGGWGGGWGCPLWRVECTRDIQTSRSDQGTRKRTGQMEEAVARKPGCVA